MALTNKTVTSINCLNLCFEYYFVSIIYSHIVFFVMEIVLRFTAGPNQTTVIRGCQYLHEDIAQVSIQATIFIYLYIENFAAF